MNVPNEAPEGSAAALVKENGLEALRGVPLTDGINTLYVSDRALDDAIEQWNGFPASQRASMSWRSRLYGSADNCPGFDGWIYLYNVWVQDVALAA